MGDVTAGVVKYLNLCLFGLSLLLLSCNHKTEQLYQTLSVKYEFEPVEYIFDWEETSKEEFQEMANLSLIINSEDDFPEENLLGLQQLKDSKINFKKYTLLIGYYRLPGIVLGHKYSFVKDLEKDIFIFSMSFRLDHELMGNPETENIFTYYRSAVLVSKIPENKEIKFSWTY